MRKTITKKAQKIKKMSLVSYKNLEAKSMNEAEEARVLVCKSCSQEFEFENFLYKVKLKGPILPFMEYESLYLVQNKLYFFHNGFDDIYTLYID